jgi:glycosyltransferase involved in cell wall biosynthesis
MNMKISVLIPVLNEEETLEALTAQVHQVLDAYGITEFELLMVDDGSTDDSWRVIKYLIEKYPETLHGIKFRKNFGKSTALNVGFKSTSGDIIVTMDGDLQDDPNEIPRMLDKIDEGYDLVSGWKKRRHDPFHKVIASRIFNLITRCLSGIKLHDFNCGYKAYRSEVLEKIDLYGELHRFIPILASRYGYRITEIPVKHHRREFGKSKFGVERYFRGVIDLLTVLTLTNFHQKPSHFFTGLGFLSGVIGTFSLSYLIILWFMMRNGKIESCVIFP